MNNNALTERARNGDIEARNRVVEENMGLVWSVVKHFLGRGTDAEDLAQIGSIGLIKAVSNFNSDFGVCFSTYAVPMITGEIRRFLRDDGPIKVSRRLKESAAKGKRCEEILRKELGRDPTINEISQKSGIDSEELVSAFEANIIPESLYSSVHENITLMDCLKENSPEDDILNRVTIEEILKELKPRERQVIVLRYLKGKTQTEISKIIGVSQVQVSRIEKNTLEKIRLSSANFMHNI